MKAAEQYFPVVLFIMLYRMVLTLESVDETLKCDHSNQSYNINEILGNFLWSCSECYQEVSYWFYLPMDF